MEEKTVSSLAIDKIKTDNYEFGSHDSSLFTQILQLFELYW